MPRRICVFCGSSRGASEGYSDAARELGQEIVERGRELVYGGGDVGLMGVIADTVLGAGGRVIGVIPASLVEREVAHPGLDDLRVVTSMHERKATMAELSDAFVALPGGLGTLEETFEVLTWAQLGIHEKPCGILDVAGYFSGLLAFLEDAVGEGFLKPAHRDLLLVDDDAGRLLDRLREYRPPRIDKWLERDEI